MKHQALDDGTVFDLDSATRYPEQTRREGHSRISQATGSQWDHEELWRTAERAWVLHAFSEQQGGHSGYDAWTQITDERAAAWLVNNGHDIPDDLQHSAVKAEDC